MLLPDHIRIAIEQYIPPLEGWTKPDRACEMAQLIIENKPKVVVELGTFGGRSAIAMAFALRENNDGGRLYSVDPWRLEYAQEGEWADNQKWWEQNISLNEIHTKCMNAIWSHNIDNWLVVIRAASQHVHQLFPSIDMLLIDGNHSEVASLRDAELYVPKVRSGGIVMADDQDWMIPVGDQLVNSTKKAVEFINVACDPVKQIGNMGVYRKR